MRKVLAETKFDNTVTLIETEDSFVVTYGAQCRTVADFKSAWDEFVSCSEHAAECASLLERFED